MRKAEIDALVLAHRGRALDDGDGDAAGEAIRRLGVDALPIRDILAAVCAGSFAIDYAGLLALALKRARSADEDWSAAAPRVVGRPRSTC